MRIESGTGTGFQAGVTSGNRLQVEATNESFTFFISLKDGQSYTWNSTFSAATGEEVIYIKNTNTTKNLHLTLFKLSSANAAVWTIFRVDSGTAAGTTISGTNLSLASSNSAQSTSYGNASVTGTLAGTVLGHLRNLAGDYSEIDYEGALILGQNDAVAITYTGSTGLVAVTVEGFFT